MGARSPVRDASRRPIPPREAISDRSNVLFEGKAR